MIVEKICPNCQTTHTGRGPFCNRKCYVEFGKDKEKVKEFRGALTEHPCLHCQKIINEEGLFCNRKCYFDFRKAHKEDWKVLIKKAHKKKCVACGKRFTSAIGYYCSKECASKKKESLEKICPRCSKPFIGAFSQTKYCSPECANVREFTPESNLKKSIKKREHYATPQGVAARQQYSRIWTEFNKGNGWEMLKIDEYAVDIPVIRDNDDFENYFDGYDRGENW